MKIIGKKWILAATSMALAVAVSCPQLSFANDDAQGADAWNSQSAMRRHGGERHRRGARGFMMGVCVGQALAQAGVALPKPAPGQRPAWDAATQAAFKAAMQSCRAEFRQGHGHAPAPAPTAAPAPTGAPAAPAGN